MPRQTTARRPAKSPPARRRPRRSRRHPARSARRRPWRLLRSWTLWGGLLLAALVYYVAYQFVVAPVRLRWRALYGDIDYPEGYSIHGIDVSHHQGSIDWPTLAGAAIDGQSISFVFIKATEGRGLLDENFNDNFYQAREYGFVRGAYHYFIPSVPAREQADYFIRQVHLEEGDLPPVLDIERSGQLTTAQLRQAALAWLQAVERHYGVTPIIYTYYKFKERYLSTPEFDRYPYWIAHYYVKDLRYKGPWKFWQHTDCGRLPGIKGRVDLNIYNGSMYDLRRLTIPEADDD